MFNSTFTSHFNSTLKQFANNNKGSFVIGRYDNQDSVEIAYKKYKIIFDSIIIYTVVSGTSYETEFSRVRLEFHSPDKLKFKLVKQGFIETIQKLFKAQDIQTGHEELDSKYLIQGSDDYKIGLLFSDINIQKLILEFPKIRLDILDEAGFFEEPIQAGRSVLYFNIDKELDSLTHFELLLDLFKAIINKLESLGSATPPMASR